MVEITGYFALTALAYSLYWFTFRKRGTVDFLRALRYWMSPCRNGRPGSAEDRALRYLSEVYGSGIDSTWANRLLAGLGIAGCAAAVLLLGSEICALYLAPGGFSRYLSGWLEIILIVGAAIPVAVMYSGKWSRTVDQRRFGAVRRIFGSLDRAEAVARVLRTTCPDASDTPTIWAFPIRPDYAAVESGKAFVYAYVFMALSSLYVARTLPRFLETLFLALALYCVPVVFQGVLTAFGGWCQKRPDLMSYPVSVFLRDLRILEMQRRWSRTL